MTHGCRCTDAILRTCVWLSHCDSIFLAASHRLSTQHSSKGEIFQLIEYFFGECILNVFLRLRNCILFAWTENSRYLTVALPVINPQLVICTFYDSTTTCTFQTQESGGNKLTSTERGYSWSRDGSMVKSLEGCCCALLLRLRLQRSPPAGFLPFSENLNSRHRWYLQSSVWVDVFINER